MESFLDAVVRREFVVGLAIAGAGLALAGSLRGPQALRRMRGTLVYLGYLLTGASMLLFVVAGFRS